MSDLLAMQRAVWRAKRSTTEKIVLLAILDHYSDSSPEPWPSVARLAEHCGLGRTTVLDALASLEGSGGLLVRRVAGGPNQYDLSQLVQALEPVRETDQSAKRTSPPAGPHQSAKRTGPVRLADPKEPNKEPTAVRAREPTRPCRSSSERSWCSETRAQRCSYGRKIGQKRNKSRPRTAPPSIASGRCPRSHEIRAFEPSSS